MAFTQNSSHLDTLQKQTQNCSESHKNISVNYQGIIELGYASGIGKYGMNNFRLNFINGLRIDPNIFFGLGLGIRYYSGMHESYSPVNSRMLVPFFLNIRTNISGGVVSPYLALNVGGTLGFDGLMKSSKFYMGLFEGVGSMFNPSIGVSFKISEKCAIIIGIAYEIQKMKFLSCGNPETKERESSLSLNCGGTF